jgi:hypothetical protein
MEHHQEDARIHLMLQDPVAHLQEDAATGKDPASTMRHREDSCLHITLQGRLSPSTVGCR